MTAWVWGIGNSFVDPERLKEDRSEASREQTKAGSFKSSDCTFPVTKFSRFIKPKQSPAPQCVCYIEIRGKSFDGSHPGERFFRPHWVRIDSCAERCRSPYCEAGPRWHGARNRRRRARALGSCPADFAGFGFRFR